MPLLLCRDPLEVYRKGEGVVPQGKEKFPFQRIIRLKRNKFERKQEGVVVDIPGCRSHQMKLPRSNKIDRTVLSSIFFPSIRRFKGIFRVNNFKLIVPVYGNLKSMENIVHVILCIGVIVCAVRTVFLEFRIHEVPPSVGFLNYNGKVEIMQL